MSSTAKKEEKPDLKSAALLNPARENLVMPQAPAVEKSILSMMTVNPTDIVSRCITDGMTGEFFYIPAHRILWELFRERYDKGLPLDVTSVAQSLTDRNQLEAVGGHPGLMEVFSYASTTALYSMHFEVLREKYIRRSIILTSTQAAEAAYTSEAEVETLLDQTEQEVLKIRQSTDSGEKWTLKADVAAALENMERMMKSKGEILGLSTGYPLLDMKINGLKAGELFVIAARPSMGKTSFMLNIMEHLALDVKKPVLVFSCEMPSVQLVERLLYARSGVSKQAMLTNQGSINKEEMKRITNAVKELQASRLVIDDTAGISIAELRAKARRVQKDHPDLCCIGIDYLQLMRSHTKQAQNSREREIAEISGGLKSLAKELKLPIVVLAQLNRGPENRPGKNKGVPMMSDLRESGAIEQDADMIGLLYRTAYYAEDDEDRQAVGSRANLALAKNRNGPTGDVPLSFIAELMRFIPREPDADEGEE
ncbi:MAG: replicative DNA helicase [Akkermansia sp.]|nr:replicative DNA helicase [Akkermansia sp.]